MQKSGAWRTEGCVGVRFSDREPLNACAEKNDLRWVAGRARFWNPWKMGTHVGCIRKMDCPGLDWVHRESQEWIIVIWS
jgi:hypothetical protein